MAGTTDYSEHMVAMRDGHELLTRIWRPEGKPPFNTILERGYEAGWPTHPERFTEAGYAYVGQQSRGNLEGGMFRQDHVDGYDCIDWIVNQDWSNGKVAMYGRSFMGATQWLVAPEQHPNLVAIVPQVVNPDLWERGYWDHGALQLSHTARRIYRTRVSNDMTHKVAEFGGWDAFYRHLPLITLDQAVVGAKNNLWQEYLTHSEYGPYWSDISITDRFDRINIPTYIHAGWYDNYPGALLKTYVILKELGNIDKLRVYVDPTDHDGRVVGDRDFGDNPSIDRFDVALRWLNWVVRGIDDGIASEPPIKFYTMGANEWRTAADWPLPGTRFAPYYFHTRGSRHGELSTVSPGDEIASEYTYDPDDPVPTHGGNHSGPQDHPEIIRVGALDQRPNWDRRDVMSFETDPLSTDFEVTGPVSARLWASTSGRDTDWIVRLMDVEPDGTAWNLCEGIIRARFRKSVFEPPELLEPGIVYEYEIELQPTSNVFLKGHKIAVHVTSSSFPMYDRNPNTGKPQGMDSDLQVAHQAIYHDVPRPSHILLPVIPR